MFVLKLAVCWGFFFSFFLEDVVNFYSLLFVIFTNTQTKLNQIIYCFTQFYIEYGITKGRKKMLYLMMHSTHLQLHGIITESLTEDMPVIDSGSVSTSNCV